jgi:hypothetical protein
MKIQEHYNITLVHQFFATLVFGDGEEIPMSWPEKSFVTPTSLTSPNSLAMSFVEPLLLVG